jgi:hypothetical protein
VPSPLRLDRKPFKVREGQQGRREGQRAEFRTIEKIDKHPDVAPAKSEDQPTSSSVHFRLKGDKRAHPDQEGEVQLGE